MIALLNRADSSQIAENKIQPVLCEILFTSSLKIQNKILSKSILKIQIKLLYKK